jgi:hypothetical protein
VQLSLGNKSDCLSLALIYEKTDGMGDCGRHIDICERKRNRTREFEGCRGLTYVMIKVSMCVNFYTLVEKLLKLSLPTSGIFRIKKS